jgi:23S rRNA pseudouridine1911/1915/1917 synthase
MNHIVATIEEKKQRLDKFLTEKLPEISRSQIKKMILNGEVLVNEKSTSVHYFLKENDEIKILTTGNDAKQDDMASKKEFRTDRSAFEKIKIIAEEKDFIILEKPEGLLVHPTDKNETNTLVDWLMEKYPDIRQVGESPERPAIVHRLDRDVSGIMLVPRTQEAFEFFKHQFKMRIINKKYTALVYGETEKEYDTIDLPISRSKTKDGLFASHPKIRGEKFQDKDKEAITEFEVKDRFINHTLLEIKILTGRTHQIRVHLQAYGYPIVGDKLYFSRKLKTKKEISRIFLHAHFLSFTGLDGTKHEFTSPLPEKLEKYLSSMKK